MRIEKAVKEQEKDITALVRTTMMKQYPNYYPKGAVELFLSYQTEENIKRAIANEEVYVLTEGSYIVGTGSIKDNRICRLVIGEENQSKGYGTALMDYLETKIYENYPCIELDASLTACEFYRKRGYETMEYKKLRASNGQYICYPMMRKAVV